MSGIAWTTVRDAIQAWVKQGSGFAGDHVIWSGQSATRPTGPFIELKLQIEQRGRGIDAQRFSVTSNVLTEKLIGQRRAKLTITAWQGAPAASSGSSVPATTAPAAIVDDVVSAARLATNNDALTAAGVGVGGVEMIDLQADVIDDVEFEARCIGSVTLHVASEVSYVYPTGVGWISTVNASGINGTDLQPINFTVTG